MADMLIPPPALAPPSIMHLHPTKRIELWLELVDEAEALLISGLRAKIGPSGDLRQAYRDWYARQMQQHDRDQIQLLENLYRREHRHGK